MKGEKEGREVTFQDWVSVHIQTKTCAHLLAAPHSFVVPTKVKSRCIFGGNGEGGRERRG